MFSLLITLAVLVHEGGHLLALLALGGKIGKVRLTPFGITLSTKRVSTYRAEFLLSMAGPFFGLVAFLLCRSLPSESLRLFAAINLFLSLFNLLPVEGLDGGSALFALLAFFLPLPIAQGILRALTWIFLILLWLIAVFLALFCGANLSLYALSLWLFVTRVLKNEA